MSCSSLIHFIVVMSMSTDHLFVWFPIEILAALFISFCMSSIMYFGAVPQSEIAYVIFDITRPLANCLLKSNDVNLTSLRSTWSLFLSCVESDSFPVVIWSFQSSLSLNLMPSTLIVLVCVIVFAPMVSLIFFVFSLFFVMLKILVFSALSCSKLAFI